MKMVIKFIKFFATVILVMLLAVIIVQRVSKNNIALGGFRVFLIVSESMAPDYLIGDILISHNLPAKDIELGDRITYLGKDGPMRGLIVTHTVMDMREENGEHFFTTQGLQNDIADPEISEKDVYGKVVYRTVIFSFFGRLMNNAYAYYGIFLVIGILFSYQVISGYVFNRRDEEEKSVVKNKAKKETEDKKTIEVLEKKKVEEVIETNKSIEGDSVEKIVEAEEITEAVEETINEVTEEIHVSTPSGFPAIQELNGADDTTVMEGEAENEREEKTD